MIDLEKKIVFVHIPKTGGTSVERYISPSKIQQDHRPLSIMINEPLLPIELTKLHRTYRRFLYIAHPQLKRYNKVFISNHDIEEYLIFSIVRDPWSRSLSWYNNVLRDVNHQKKLRITLPISFEAFLESQLGKSVLRSQFLWLKSHDGSIPSYLNLIPFKDFPYAIPDLLNDRITPHSMPRLLDSKSTQISISKHAYSLIQNYFEQEIRYFNFECSLEVE